MFASTLTKCLDQLFQTSILPLNDSTMEMISNMDENCSIFIITSTTGNGEPPHHGIAFKGALEDAVKNGKQVIKNLKYAVFALGSSMYENFCSFGIFCDSNLETLGGQRIAPLVLGDEQKGQDKAFRSWTKLALMGICEALKMEIPRQVEEKWPFSRTRVRRASWVPHSFRTTNSIEGNIIFSIFMLIWYDSLRVDLLDSTVFHKSQRPATTYVCSNPLFNSEKK